MKWLLWAALGTASCTPPAVLASGSLAKPVAEFPSQAEVEQLTPSGHPPELPGATGIADVDQWQMQAPAPSPPEYPDETIWDHTVLRAWKAHESPVTLSPQLRCAAEEIARFYTAQGGMPDDGLREHLLLRCGSTLASHDFSYTYVQAPDRASAAQIERALEPLVQRMLDQRFQDPKGELGVAAARGHGRSAVVAVSGHPLVEFAAFSPIIQGDSITLSGELKLTADHVLALVNQGTYGVAHCDADPMTRLPAFRVTCPIAATDVATRIDIAARQEGRVLLNAAAEIEVRRDEQAELSYNGAAYGANHVVASTAEFRAELFAELNRARSAAGLRPLTLESKQSDTDERLAPYFYQAEHSGDKARADNLALGMLAGWDVAGGMLQDGGFFVRSVNTTRNPSRWLTQVLDSPLGRFMLLEPDMSQIAIAESDLTPSGAMGLVTTYAFFASDDHRPDEVAILAELDRQRRAHGVAPARRVPTDAPLQEAIDQVHTNVTTAQSALLNALQRLRSSRNNRLSGYSLETNDIKQLKFDSLLLESTHLELELAVTHYRAPGAAWGQYVLLFVIVDHGPTNGMARRAITGATPG
jgi:hypothetical protein